MSKEDIACIESIAKIVSDLDLEAVDYNKDGLHIIVTNRTKEVVTAVAAPTVQIPVTPAAPVVATVPATESAPAAAPAKGEIIKSPMVGVLYLSAGPNDPDYIKVGDMVRKGDILCLIEAMKTFNQIKAQRDGIIREILVAPGAAVEYDEPLFVLE